MRCILAAHVRDNTDLADRVREVETATRLRSRGLARRAERSTFHDLQAEAEGSRERALHIGRGIRTLLVTPLLREGSADRGRSPSAAGGHAFH